MLLYCYYNDSYLLVMCFAAHVHQIRGNACKAAFTICTTAAFLCFCKVLVQSVHSGFEDMAFNLFIESCDDDISFLYLQMSKEHNYLGSDKDRHLLVPLVQRGTVFGTLQTCRHCNRVARTLSYSWAAELAFRAATYGLRYCS